MNNDTADILKRLERKGANALELLQVYQDQDHEPLWRMNPSLYTAFARKLISEGHPTRAFELAREGLAYHAENSELQYLLALALEQACPPPLGGSGAGMNLKYLGMCGEMGF